MAKSISLHRETFERLDQVVERLRGMKRADLRFARRRNAYVLSTSEVADVAVRLGLDLIEDLHDLSEVVELPLVGRH